MTYEIKNDTINAIIISNYSNANSMLFSNFRPVHFRGITKDKNTVIDWHPLNPFLKAKNPLDSQPVVLVFRPLIEKQFIDSNKAWINKYRN